MTTVLQSTVIIGTQLVVLPLDFKRELEKSFPEDPTQTLPTVKTMASNPCSSPITENRIHCQEPC